MNFSIAENQTLGKAYLINTELDELLGDTKNLVETENSSWERLLEANGVVRQKLPSDLFLLDHVIYSIAGITGGLLDLSKKYTKAMKNKSLEEHFDNKCKDLVEKITGKDSGIPAIDNSKGGGDHHRMLGPTHDLFRIFETIKGIMRGEFHLKIDCRDVDRLIRSYGKKTSDYIKIEDPVDAFIVLFYHLVSDFFSSRSLPIPGRTKKLENGDAKLLRQLLKEFRSGGNLRSLVADFLNTLSSALFIAIFLRFYRYIDMYAESGSVSHVIKNFQLKDDIKYHYLVRNASTICFTISIGKAAFTNNLSAINYINFIQIVKSGMSINRLSKTEQNRLYDRFQQNILAIEGI